MLIPGPQPRHTLGHITLPNRSIAKTVYTHTQRELDDHMKDMIFFFFLKKKFDHKRLCLLIKPHKHASVLYMYTDMKSAGNVRCPIMLGFLGVFSEKLCDWII